MAHAGVSSISRYEHTNSASPAPDSSGHGRRDGRPSTAMATPRVQSWAHLLAGGAGGMMAAVLTSPLDVLKTRLQSNLHEQLHSQTVSPKSPPRRWLHQPLAPVSDAWRMLLAIQRHEGWSALFRGLGPTLSGIVPASAIKFYVYGTSKGVLADRFNHGHEAAWIHLLAGVSAGVAVSTATNPLWVVKTRLQLDRTSADRHGLPPTARRYRNSLDCARQCFRQEGLRGLYRGLGASYLGVSESTIQWIIYEQMKARIARRRQYTQCNGRSSSDIWIWTQQIGAAAGAKLIATGVTYPHEVVRTRLRQIPDINGNARYRGVVDCFRQVRRQEGFGALYGGMTAHLLRVIPSTAVIFGTYEGVLHVLRWYM